jgi:hypothetical protein
MADDHTTPSTSLDPPHDAVSRSFDVLAALLAVLGPGEHAITCTASLPSGIGHGRVTIQQNETGRHGRGSPWDLINFIAVLATALDERHQGAIVIRSRPANGDSEGGNLRAWVLDGTWPQPLTSADVRTAHLTHPVTGELLPPEPDIQYLPGIALPRPEAPDA